MQAWANKVLPLLSKHLAQHVDSILWQPLLAQEALLCNLLEVALYHQHACAAMSEDALMELCDYCQRKLALLHSKPVPLQSGVSLYHILYGHHAFSSSCSVPSAFPCATLLEML